MKADHLNFYGNKRYCRTQCLFNCDMCPIVVFNRINFYLSQTQIFFLYFLLNKAVSKLIGECKSTGKCQNDLATVLHLTLVPIMMKTYITIATFHIAIRLCSYCCMSRVIGQHNIQVEVLFPWGKKFTCTIFLILDLLLLFMFLEVESKPI